MEIYFPTLIATPLFVLGVLRHIGAYFFVRKEKKEWLTTTGDAYGASGAFWILQLALEHSLRLQVVFIICVIATLALAGRCLWLVNYRYRR